MLDALSNLDDRITKLEQAQTTPAPSAVDLDFDEIDLDFDNYGAEENT
jgi:hypothetical protein